MDPGDSAAWTAAIVAIVAAFIAAASMGVALWQAKSAKRSADTAEDDLVESRKQTKAAEQAAAAAERQVSEAQRQNEITERQLKIAQEELEAGRERHQQEKAARHVARVHEILLAADDLRDELYDDAKAVIEHPGSADDFFGVQPQLIMLGHAESAWEAAVNTIRVDKPPSGDVTAAIDAFHKYATSAITAIEDARDKAVSGQLSTTAAEALADLIARRDDAHEDLKRACDEFFAAQGVDPGDLTAT